MADLKDSILTNITARRMVNHVSPIYGNSYVGLWIFEAISREYEEAWGLIRTLPDQLYPELATWAIELWEQRYGIEPDPSLDIEERRRRVVIRRTVPRPMNPETLIMMIYNITGRRAEVEEHTGPYTFGVYIDNTEGGLLVDFDAIMALIRKHKQAHKSFDLAFQSSGTIHANIETGYWRFPYPMAGTAEAGALPDINIQVTTNTEGLVIEAGATSYLIPYPLAGTLPDINTINGTGMAAVVAAGGGESYTAPYIPCGTLSAGAAI